MKGTLIFANLHHSIKSPMTDRRTPMSRNSRGGFTLVELLVVITIIGILVGLLLPAVQGARETARRAQCANHLKQLGLAVLQFEQRQGAFPSGGWGWSWIGDPDRGNSIKQPGGWIFVTLPMLDQMGMYNLQSGKTGTDRLNAAATLAQTPLEVLYCPSRRQPLAYPNIWSGTGFVAFNCGTSSTSVRGDYAINAGDQANDQFWAGPSTLAQGDDPSFAWNNTSAFTGISYERSRVKMAHITDGASNTYLIGEKYLNPDAYFNGQDGADNGCAYNGYENDRHRCTYRDPTTGVGLTPMQDTQGFADEFRFGSAHAGSAQFVFCDGSLHTISYNIDAETHRRLGNRADGAPLDGSKMY